MDLTPEQLAAIATAAVTPEVAVTPSIEPVISALTGIGITESVVGQAPSIGRIVIINDYIAGARRDFPGVVSAINANGTLDLCGMPARQAPRPLNEVQAEGKQPPGGVFWRWPARV